MKRFVVCLLMMLCGLVGGVQAASPFESLGKPVTKAGHMGTIVGPGPAEGSERIYFNFRQDGGKLFLVAIDPETGTSEQFQSPAGTGAWGFIVGPDDKIYLGTHEGPDKQDSGRVLVFDPKQPEKEIEVVGRPSASESYLWMYTIGPDKKLYACTYPQAKLVSFDPASGEMKDHGRMDETQKYSRSICTGPDGKIYIGIGYGKANVIRFDPKTGDHEAILPEQYRKYPAQTVASVYLGVDGNVYVSVITMTEDGKKGSAILVANDDGLTVADKPATALNRATLKDGRRVSKVSIDGTYTLVSPDGTKEKKTFSYEGAGSGIFMVDNGPLGQIYGGTYMPNELFYYDPATGKSENPGNATEVGGEIYSMLDHNGILYVCAYPGSFLSKWDPTKPWKYGREAGSNPQGFGRLGPGHLRPRTMIHGPEDTIYIGSYPEYGLHGGALGVWDTNSDTLVENYHPLIKNQSIVSLVYDEKTGLIFGGTSTTGGGGTTPIEPSAKFFAFDPSKKALKFERVLDDEFKSIRSMCQVGRNLYIIGGGDDLVVYNIDQDKVLLMHDLEIGHVADVSLRLWKDGQIYGVGSKQIFKLDPVSYKLTILAEYPGRIRCGMAIDDHGIYFGDSAELMRYNWPVAKGAK